MHMNTREKEITPSSPHSVYVLTTARAALAISAEKSLLPEQKSIDDDAHARAIGDIISEHTST